MMKLCKDCKHFWREGISGFYCLSPQAPPNFPIGVNVFDAALFRKFSDDWACSLDARFFEPREE